MLLGREPRRAPEMPGRGRERRGNEKMKKHEKMKNGKNVGRDEHMRFS